MKNNIKRLKPLYLIHLFAVSHVWTTKIIIIAIASILILSCPGEKPIIRPARNTDEQFEEMIKLLKKQIYAIDKEGEGISEIRIYYFDEHSLKYSGWAFGSYNVKAICPLEVSLGDGRLDTYICPNENEFAKLASVFKSGSFKEPTLRYNDFLIVSYGIDVKKAKRIFNNLKKEAELPPIFTKYFDVIGYLFNSQKILETSPKPSGLWYRKNLDIFQSAEIISSPKTTEGIVIHIGWEDATGIIITDFNSNYLKFYTDLSFSDSLLLNEPVNVDGVIGRFREIKETIFYSGSRSKRIRYFHMLFFRFGEMLMYIRFPITSNRIDSIKKDEWLNDAAHIIKTILPYLSKYKNEQFD